MMREPYWGLFWSTGMPEAWLMSRSGERADAGLKIEGPWGLSGPVSYTHLTLPTILLV